MQATKIIPDWFPIIGEIITSEQGCRLAKFFGFTEIVRRIETNPERYKDFVFDGCSCLPDQLLGLFTGCDWRDITYWACLPHDIMYAYGKAGSLKEKKVADYLFHNNLINEAKMKRWLASVFLSAVEMAGGEEFKISNVSWSFATKKGKEEWA